MRGNTRSKRSLVRKLGVLVCAATLVGTLAGVARSVDGGNGVFCPRNITIGGNVGACVRGSTDFLLSCLPGCRASRGKLSADCTVDCVEVFLFCQQGCLDGSSNTTAP